MLLKYTVSNFKSIGHNIEFSMFPLEGNTDKRFLTEIDTVAGKWKVLKRGAFFGPNAAGKTSFVKSLAFAKDYIVKGPNNITVNKVDQFRGEIDELNGITSFEFIFYINGQVYNYGFSLDRMIVHEERLAVLNENAAFSLLFERETTPDRITNINVYDEYAKPSSPERDLAEVLVNSIKEKQANHLFIYKLAENGSDIAERVIHWFKGIQVIYPSSKPQALPIRIQKDDHLREFLSEKLCSLDTGVIKVSAIKKNIKLEEFAEKYDIPNEVIRQIEEIQNGIINLNGKFYFFKEGKKQNISLIQVKFEHSLNKKSVDFDIDDESDGTQRMLDLLPFLFKANLYSHTIYVVDELDRSLHTKLSKFFIETFGEQSTNTQLLFTAHDVNLLNLHIFRQEEIWFVEKNGIGETTLKPFSDFDIIDGQNILKDYLAGRFGAVPVIKEDK